MAAAVSRPAGFEQEAITPEQALALYTKPADDAGGKPRRVAVGELANLCLLDRSWAQAAIDFADLNVSATWIGGNLDYDTISSIKPQSNAV
jgi:predicted amidohydrolase YtcJ